MEPTGSDSPHQNGKVERLNGTFGVMVGTLLYLSGLPPQYWSAALVHAVHLKNRLWHSALDVSPFEAWNGSQPDLSHLRVFGSLLSAKFLVADMQNLTNTHMMASSLVMKAHPAKTSSTLMFILAT